MNKVNNSIPVEHEGDRVYEEVDWKFTSASDLYLADDSAREARRFFSLNEGNMRRAIRESGIDPLLILFPTNPDYEHSLDLACDQDTSGVLRKWRDDYLPSITRVESPTALAWRLQLYLQYLKEEQHMSGPLLDWPATIQELYAVVRYHYQCLLNLGYVLPQQLMPPDAINYETCIYDLMRACSAWSNTDRRIDPAPLEKYRMESLRQTAETLSHTKRRLLLELTDDLQLASDLAIRIGKGPNADGDIDRSKASRCLKGMREAGLVRQPAGERKGWTYTNLGREL